MNIARDTLTEAIKRALGLTFSVTTVMGGTVAMAQDDVDDGEEIKKLITGSKPELTRQRKPATVAETICL